MDYKIVWSEAAIANLHEICSYIAQDDPRAAQRVGEGVLNHVRILGTFPFIGPACPRGSQGPLREIVFRRYRIFYEISEELRQVQVLHVWHGARDEPIL